MASAPRQLPKLELDDGVPAALRTLVVMPCAADRRGRVASSWERLEVHYLAQPTIRTSTSRCCPTGSTRDRAASTGDEALLALAPDAASRELNARHGPAPDGDRVLLFHRRRRWNEREAALDGLGAQARQARTSSTSCCAARPTRRFVTERRPSPWVPSRRALRASRSTPTPACRATPPASSSARWPTRSTAPRLDAGTGRVVEGYGILQPRVTPSLPEIGEGSPFQRVFSGPAGIDPYAFAVSDVYQDLFGEGIFTGKGIYDVDAFERALAGRVPENTLLSHDLFEGLFARAGLAVGRRAVRELPGALPGRRRRASTAGPAATGSSCRGCSAADRAACPPIAALEDARQPAPHAARADRPRDPGRRLVCCPSPRSGSGPAFVAVALDRPGPVAGGRWS